VEELKPTRREAVPGTGPGHVDRTRAAAAIGEFLRALGFDPQRDPELANTARLVADAYAGELLAGYRLDPAQILARSVGAEGSDLVAVRGIQTTIMCPHHLLPASGVVSLAYAPNGRVVGLGALGELVTCFARRLTLQETLVQQVADALMTHLGARGAACVAELNPTCLTARHDDCHAARALTVATAGEMKPGGALHGAFVATLLSGRTDETGP
jgi:GTP cyclohydrolase IA